MTAALEPKNAVQLRPSREAKILLDTARQLAKNGNTKGSIGILNKILASYPKTSTANEAREALNRPSRNLPLFLDRPTVVASPGTPAAKPAEMPAPVVNASPVVGAPVGPGAPGAGPAGSSRPTRPRAPRAPDGRRDQGRRRDGRREAPAPRLPPADRGGTARLGLAEPGRQRPRRRDDGPDPRGLLHPHGAATKARPRKALSTAVTLDSYYIDQHEVTVRQYHFYLKETGGKLPATKAATKGDSPHAADADELPAVEPHGPRGQGVLRLGRQAPPDRGPVGSRRADDRRSSPSLGRQFPVLGSPAGSPADRRGDVVPARPVALRRLRPGRQRQGMAPRTAGTTHELLPRPQGAGPAQPDGAPRRAVRDRRRSS